MKTILGVCAVLAALGALTAQTLSLNPRKAERPADLTHAVAPASQPGSPPSGTPIGQVQPGAQESRPVYTADESINISVYENSNRSVVNIRTIVEGRDPFWMLPVSSEGSGSGWVYDRRGHIVTNYHVVEDSDQIDVTLFDGQTKPARVVGADLANDIAVLKIDVDRESLFPMELGDSSAVKVGQKALAIGNPFGLERTLTVGIVSSLNRTLESKTKRGRQINSVIQIDAALNQGNSGGPLLNSQSKMIGMNTAIASLNREGAQNSGVGFAVPANTIRRVIPQLIEHGRVIRATAGIYNVLRSRRGLMIVLVEPNGPADKAGLRGSLTPIVRQIRDRTVLMGFRENPESGDLVLAINNVKVDNWDAMLDEVEKFQPGETVTFTIERGRRVMDVQVRLASDN